MPKAHINRMAMPKTWKLDRKSKTWIARPYPGGQPAVHTMPLLTVLRDLLKVARTRREIKYILREKGVLVDGKRRNDDKYPIGLFSVVSIPALQVHYRMLLTRLGALTLVPIPPEEAGLKPCRVADKGKIKNGALQIRLSDGRTLLSKNQRDQYAVGDTLFVSLPKQEVKEHITLTPGNYVFLVGGKHAGTSGKITEISGSMIRFTGEKGSVATSAAYAYAIGKEKPMISLPQGE